MNPEFFARYLSSLKALSASARVYSDLADRLAPVVSSQIVKVPLSVWSRVQSTVRDLHTFAHSEKFISALKPQLTDDEKALLAAPAQDSSVLMAYDFHYVAATDRLALIEVNTNASMYLLAEHLYRTETIETPWGDSAANLRSAFFSECQTRGLNPNSALRVAVVDENIPQQKMRVEFDLYVDLFRSWGWQADLVETNTIKPENFDFIYNRDTDFLFTEPKSKLLRQAFISGQSVISPHPREYLLMAAKDRLLDFNKMQVAPDVLLPIFAVTGGPDADTLWADRKKLFFKPKRSFGAKGVYRGASISRKMFQEILTQDYLAQEFQPPDELDGWKYDLRFYAYKSTVQLGMARLYQGQVTNMSQPGGGAARLTFT